MRARPPRTSRPMLEPSRPDRCGAMLPSRRYGRMRRRPSASCSRSRRARRFRSPCRPAHPGARGSERGPGKETHALPTLRSQQLRRPARVLAVRARTAAARGVATRAGVRHGAGSRRREPSGPAVASDGGRGDRRGARGAGCAVAAASALGSTGQSAPLGDRPPGSYEARDRCQRRGLSRSGRPARGAGAARAEPALSRDRVRPRTGRRARAHPTPVGRLDLARRAGAGAAVARDGGSLTRRAGAQARGTGR